MAYPDAVSLGVAFKGPEGIVLAADSRVTMTAQTIKPSTAPGVLPTIQTIPSYFDNARKLLTIKSQPYVGIVTYGAGAIGQAEPRTAHGFMPEFEAHLSSVCAEENEERLSTRKIAEEIGTFFTQQWADAGMPNPAPPEMQQMVFLVGGFDDGEPYGHVYELQVPNEPTPVEKTSFGVTYGGQNELVARLLGGVDMRALELTKSHLGLDDTQAEALAQLWKQNLGLPIPYQFLPLQDCVDLSEFMVSMTTIVQTWTFGIRGVGGQVDVATITRTEGLREIRQKKVQVWD